MLAKPALSRRMLFSIFTISGFSGLIYESIWSHYLKLFLGHAAYAQTLVLAIFMGGMALGAWLVARSTSRLRNLLVAYAAVELVTGVIALVFHGLYSGATSFAFDSIIPAIDSASGIAVFKWTLAAVLILPQSILLGTTFPLISGGVIRRFPERSGETLAMLYFTNSFGAALGVLASGFVLIGKVGLPGTVMFAGMMNVLLALFVWLLARGEEPGAVIAAPAPAPKAAETPTPSPVTSAIRWICLASFLAGLAAFLYEIAWIRMLSLVLGSSTHSFELMLSAFIFGLALGGLWVRRRIDSFKHPRRTLGIMFAVMAALAVLTLPSYSFAFDVMATTLQMFGATEPGYAGFNLMSNLIAAAMMLPTTIVAGMTLPLMTHVLLREGAGEQAIGKVYAANTVGAIAGVLLAVHLFMPWVGTKGIIVVGALVQIGVAILLLRRERPEGRNAFSKGALVASALVVAFVAVTVQLDPTRMASGVYRRGIASLPDDARVKYLRDGKTATISLVQQGYTVAIATNGKPDAAINMGPGLAGEDEITMTLAAALPLVMHPAPKRIANIGIGSGLTSHVALTSPIVEVLDSIEIEPMIVEAARIGFEPRVRNLFHDPRSHIHYEDAKTFFASAKHPYDVIISEPSNPWVSGVATLFSGEFYAHVKRYLGKGGLLIQWVQIYETDVSVVASILKALDPHFTDYAIYNTDDTNMLIVATVEGTLPELDPRAIGTGALAAELRKVGIESVNDIAIRRIGSKQILAPMFASFPVPKNSDYFPYVDQTAPKMRFLRANALDLGGLRLHSIPIMELLAEPALPWLKRENPEISFTERQRRTERAMSIVTAITQGDLRDLAPDVGQDVVTIDASASRCAGAGTTRAWMNAVELVSVRTTPFLPPAELEPLWQMIRAKPCFAALDPAQHQRLSFLQAVAARDRARVRATGNELLNASGAQDVEQRVEVLLAVVAAMLGEDDVKAAAQRLHTDMALVESLRSNDLSVRLLEAVTIARLVPASRAKAAAN